MDRNRKALTLIEQLGIGKGLTARVDPPRVGSKAKSPMNDVQVVKAAYSTNRHRVRTALLDGRQPEFVVGFLDRQGTSEVTMFRVRNVTFMLMWPEVHPAIQSYMTGAEYEVWGTLDQVTVLVERGSHAR